MSIRTEQIRNKIISYIEMAKVTNCYAQPLNQRYKALVLPDSELVHLGRNLKTGIPDLVISKNQLALKANYEKKIVECVSQGINPSGCNGFALKTNQVYTFTNGDRLEVGLGKYIYQIVFESAEEENKSKKRKVTSSEEEIELPGNFKGDWQFINDSLLIYTPDIHMEGNRVASFDMDGTLINTKSGDRFPKDKNDWKLAFGMIKEKLKMLYASGYRIVIFSNQLRLGQEKQMIPSFKQKVENVIQNIGVPTQVFLATQRDIYRKPAPGMWNELLKMIDGEINVNESFYVGDAAGRQENWAPHTKKDHSIADRLYAINIGLKFYTPEEYFLKGKSVPYVMPEFDPRTVTSFMEKVPISASQEVIIMVGSQGSGKSHFCNVNLTSLGYTYINRDTLGSKKKCLDLVEENLKAKKSIVIDNTNPDCESRKPYLELCKKYQVPCKCFHMNISIKQCKHNNKFRSLIDKKHIQINDIIINSYWKKFQQPTVEEGFIEIHQFKFNANFKSKDEEMLYKMFLLES